jgi:hypothetical protein
MLMAMTMLAVIKRKSAGRGGVSMVLAYSLTSRAAFDEN